MVTRKDFLKGIVASIIGSQCLSVQALSAQSSCRNNLDTINNFDDTALLRTIVRIEQVDCYDTKEVYVECSALDSLLDAFKLTLYFASCEKEDLGKIANDLKIGSIFLVEGGILSMSDGMRLMFPHYKPYPDTLYFSVHEIERCFQNRYE